MEIQSNIIPGSVWGRVKKNGEKSQVTVLLVTNQGCSTKVLESNPHQVVFLTEQSQVLSMTIDQFLNNRVYEGKRADIEAGISYILNPDTESEEEVIDLDTVEADEKLFDSMLPEEVGDDDTTELEPEDVNSLSINVGPHPYAESLTQNFVSYTEAPYHTGDTLHTLKFRLGSDLSLETVAQAFKVSDPNSIQTFEVTTATTSFKVEVDSYITTMLESTYEDLACLYILSNGDFRAVADTASLDVQEVVEGQPQVDQSPDNNTITIDVS